jgi:hypothetical protein
MHPAEQFLQALDPTLNEKFLFVFLHATKTSTQTNYGKLDLKYLEGMNRNGYDVYVTVNRTIAGKRDINSMAYARALWQEDDKTTKKLPPIEADIIVESSPGHFHRYWLLGQNLKVASSLALWNAAQAEMVNLFDSDPNAKDVTRVLRVPGFRNLKKDCDVVLHKAVRPAMTPNLKTICQSLFGCLPNLKAPAKDSCDAAKSAKTDNELTQIELWLREIESGEHLHGPVRNIMLINANNGMDRYMNMINCKLLIEKCPDAARREKALQDLKGMLDATYNKVEEERSEPSEKFEIPKSSVARLQESVAFAPGQAGELMQAMYDMSHYPNRVFCVVGVMGLLSGIAGRRYNVDSLGLNTYITCLAKTGSGKDMINKFIQRVLNDKTIFGQDGSTFWGPGYFTGPASVRRHLETRKSFVSVIDEAGLANASEAGDKNGLSRIFLELYSSSGQLNTLSEDAYSDPSKSHGILHAPSFSYINTSTPDMFKALMAKRKSFATGEYPRMWLFEVVGQTPYETPVAPGTEVPLHLKLRLNELMTDCINHQTSQIPDVLVLPKPAWYYPFSNHCVDMNNRYSYEDKDRAAVYTRAAIKVLKTAALIAVFNGHMEIHKDEWDWAVELFNFELSCLPDIIRIEQPIEDVVARAAVLISNLLSKHYNNADANIPEELKKHNIFLESNFYKFARKIPAISNYGQEVNGTPRSGVSRALQFMVNEGYLRKVSSDTLRIMAPKCKASSQAYQTTQLFLDIVNSYR